MMTPAEIQKAMDDLKSESLVDHRGWIHASVHGGLATITAYDEKSKQIALGEADDWSEAIEKCRSALIARSVDRDLSLVRKMALSIIDLTDAGICDMDALIKAGFSVKDITSSGVAACELAAKITSVEAYHIHAEQVAA